MLFQQTKMTPRILLYSTDLFLQFVFGPFIVEGRWTLCSSILLACDLIIRLKKSSSGTVGPFAADGGAHL